MRSRASLSVSAAVAAATLALGLTASGAVGASAANGLSPAVVAKLAQPGTPSPLAGDRIYFVLTDRYANGDPSNDTGGKTGSIDATGYDPTSPAWWHGGDFKGLTGGCTTGERSHAHQGSRLQRGLGHAARREPDRPARGTGGYHGYWGTDFMHVDPAPRHRPGLRELRRLRALARDEGLPGHRRQSHRRPDPARGIERVRRGPYRDCHGKVFDPQKYVGTSRFPCLSAAHMPKQPYFLSKADATAKNPAWLNNPLNYHDRGNIDFSSCSEQCNEWGDFAGLDDLFTEKPNVEKASPRSTPRGSPASTSTASASIRCPTSIPASSSSGCRRS